MNCGRVVTTVANAFQATLASAYVALLAQDLARELAFEFSSPRFVGHAAGRLLRWAYDLVDDGARVQDVRLLIEIGMKAGRQPLIKPV